MERRGFHPSVARGTRRLVTWVGVIGVLMVLFVVFSCVSQGAAMPTPQLTAEPPRAVLTLVAAAPDRRPVVQMTDGEVPTSALRGATSQGTSTPVAPTRVASANGSVPVSAATA